MFSPGLIIVKLFLKLGLIAITCSYVYSGFAVATGIAASALGPLTEGTF